MEKYIKIKLIGRGAHGSVYLCHSVTGQRNVVIKEVSVDQMSKDEREVALNESKVLSMLDHPNIITYLENFLTDHIMFIVMEYAEGGTLFEYLQSCKGQLLSEEKVLYFFSQLVLALEYVHSQQILHRDLKSPNILLNKHHNVLKISDFGISKIMNSKSRAVTVVGTPFYLSPELCEGQPYNQKSDIWALGCVLYELLTLQRPFDSDNLTALVKKIMQGHYNPVSTDYSSDLRQLLASMLHLDPDMRPNANQIMAQPFMIPVIFQAYMSIGCLPYSPCNESAIGQACQLSGRGSADSSNLKYDCTKWKKTEIWYVEGHAHEAEKLPLPSGITVVKQVSLCGEQKVGLTVMNQLIVWEKSRNSPFSVRANKFTSGVASVACGENFTVCLSESGVVSTFGKVSSMCLANNSTRDIIEPKVVESLFGNNILMAVCGSRHVIVLSEDNALFSWGHNVKGCLGLGNTKEFHPQPQLIELPIPKKIAKVFCGPDCSFAVTNEKVLLSCGSNNNNKIAQDTEDGLSIDEISVFMLVRSDPLPFTKVEMVSCGITHSAILTDSGEVYTVGSNRYGQLGWGNRTLLHTMPGVVKDLAEKKVLSLRCGDCFTLALVEGGILYAWGKCPKTFENLDDEVKQLKCNWDSKSENVTIRSIDCCMNECLFVTH